MMLKPKQNNQTAKTVWFRFEPSRCLLLRPTMEWLVTRHPDSRCILLRFKYRWVCLDSHILWLARQPLCQKTDNWILMPNMWLAESSIVSLHHHSWTLALFAFINVLRSYPIRQVMTYGGKNCAFKTSKLTARILRIASNIGFMPIVSSSTLPMIQV